MFIFDNAKTFVNFLNKKFDKKFDIEWINNHFGYILIKKNKPIGSFELADKIYLDLNDNYL